MIRCELTKIAYNYTHENLPVPVMNLFVPNAANHHYNTRSRHFPQTEHHTTDVYHRSFLAKVPITWQNTPANIRNCKTTSALSRYFKKITISNY